MKKVLITLIVLVLVASAALIGLVVYQNQPELVALRAITGSAKQFTERDEIAFVYDTLRQGSIDFTVKEWEDEDGEDTLEGGSFSGKLYFSDSAIMLEDFNLDLYEVQLDGSAYLSEEMVYIEENEILGEAYGINFSDLSHDFKKSIFAHDANSPYSLPENISDIIENYDHENALAMKEDAAALSKALPLELWGVFCDNVSIESEIDEVRVGGEKIKARVIHIEITGDDLADFLEDALDVIEDHPELNDFIDTYEDVLKEMFTSLDLYIPEDLDESSSFRKIYDEYLEMLRDEVDDFCKEATKDMETIDIEIVTPRFRSNLLLLTVEYDGDTVFSLDCGKKGIKKSDKITLKIFDESYVYEVKKNDEEDFALSITCDKENLLSIDIDRKREDFTVTVGEDYSSTFEGTFDKSGKETTIKLKDFTRKYYSYFSESTVEYSYTTNTTITLMQKDEMPLAPTNFKTIDSITEKDVDAWIEKLDG